MSWSQKTFIGVLVKATKCIDVFVTAVRHRGIDQTCGDMTRGLFDARSIVPVGEATARRTGG